VPVDGDTEPLTEVLGVGRGLAACGGLRTAATASTSANAASTTAVAAFSREVHVTGAFYGAHTSDHVTTVTGRGRRADVAFGLRGNVCPHAS
jgi:hypothetical protein